MDNMTAIELRDFLAKESDHVMVIDVREQHELQYGMIEGAHHIPMNTVTEALPALMKRQEDTFVIVCHAGMRSAHVADYLGSMEGKTIINLTGGMNAWAQDVDQNVRVY